MKYNKACVQVVMFDNSDVVTTSGCKDQTSFKAENPDGVWGCEDLSNKLAGT